MTIFQSSNQPLLLTTSFTMKYYIQETCLQTEKVAYLTIQNQYGYSLRSSGRLQTLFSTHIEAMHVLDNHLVLYPNTQRRETIIRIFD